MVKCSQCVGGLFSVIKCQCMTLVKYQLLSMMCMVRLLNVCLTIKTLFIVRISVVCVSIRSILDMGTGAGLSQVPSSDRINVVRQR